MKGAFSLNNLFVGTARPPDFGRPFLDAFSAPLARSDDWRDKHLCVLIDEQPDAQPPVPFFWGRGSGGVKSAGVSQSVRKTGRDESQSVPSPEKLFKTRDLELPTLEGSVPSCSPHSAGYTRTSVHPYFPVTNSDSSDSWFEPRLAPQRESQRQGLQLGVRKI